MKTLEDFKPCSDTGMLAGVMAVDAATLVDALSDLIGAGSQDANTLAGMRLMAARVGMVADALARAHGGEPWAGSADEWAFADDDRLLAWHRMQRRLTPCRRPMPTPGEVPGSPAGAAVVPIARPIRQRPDP